MTIAKYVPQQPYTKSPIKKKTIEDSMRMTEYATTVLRSTPSNGGKIENLQPVNVTVYLVPVQLNISQNEII